jgi:probable rRNA maturation factor
MDGGRAAPKIRIDVEVEDMGWRRNPEAQALVRRAARLALSRMGTGGGHLTILLTGDARLKGLNTHFRGKNKPTNVLSFPSSDPAYLGDIAIAYGVVAREAKAQKKRIKAHAAHLAVHGVLHLLGFDHEIETDAVVMEGLETRILATLGLADPYRNPMR